jgi:RNA polymerase sigma-70 factor (ECF subfamily)
MADVKGPDMPELFERLVETYQTPLRRLCCVMLKDAHLADDAVQETFLKAYRALNDFRRESSGKTWLTRIAVNTCRDMMRSRWLIHVDRSVDIADLPEESAESDPEDTELMETVLRLPMKQREAVLLYYYQNLTMQEISEILHITVSNVSRRLESARKALRKQLEGGKKA